MTPNCWFQSACPKAEDDAFAKADEQLEHLSKDARISAYEPTLLWPNPATSISCSVKIHPVCKPSTLMIMLYSKSHSSGRAAFERDTLQFARDVAMLGQLIEAEGRNEKLGTQKALWLFLYDHAFFQTKCIDKF